MRSAAAKPYAEGGRVEANVPMTIVFLVFLEIISMALVVDLFLTQLS